MNVKFLGEGTEFDVGSTVRIESTIKATDPFEDESQATLTDPSIIEITIIEYDGTNTVDEVNMTQESTGKYYFNWDTTGLDAGDYEIVVHAEQDGTKHSEDDWIRITD